MNRHLEVRQRVLMALFRREAATRFAGKRLGFLWMFFEPLVQILIFGLIFYFGGRQGPHGMDVFVFMLYGIVPFMFFQKVMVKTAGAIPVYKVLLSYPIMRPIDAMAARALFEFMTCSLILPMLTLVALHQRMIPGVARPEFILIAVTMCSAMGFALGILLGALSSRYSFVEKLTPIISRVTFLTSGVFFSYSMLPQFAREILWWNPVLHLTEAARHGVYVNFPSFGFWLWYPAVVTLLLFASGFAALNMAERDPDAKIRGVS